MLSTAVMAFFGFFFWIINTRLFTAEQIGLSTALISSITLITGFSMVGMNQGIIRYLPKSNRKTDKINTVITVVLLSTLIASGIYILGLKSFSPKLSFLRENILFLVLFIAIAISSSFESIYNNVFIAFRNTKYILYNNIFKSIIKLLLPAVLITLGSFAIFVSASLGTIFIVFVSIFILHKLYSYKFRLTFKKDIFRNMYKLSFGNYIASLLAGLPLTLLPIMITNTLGPKQAAYFYMDMMIVNLLNTIQSSVNNSLFAEGSNNDKELKKHIFKSITFISLLLIPFMLVVVLFGGHILLAFGKEYSNEGVVLLRLLALSVIFTSINGMLSSILNVKGKVNLILMMCIIGPSILLALIYFALPKGLVPLGYAWLIGEAIISLIYMTVVFLKAL